jgi:sulfur relay (sulfurtransferase) complex TusBCD TusD component (DsrE family)
MRAEIFYILFFTVLSFVLANAVDIKKKDEDNARVFLSTFTVIVATITTTATTTSVTTCTTSAAALTTCSAGRRRRGLLYDENDEKGHARRGLFYNDDNTELQNDSSSLPNVVKRCSILN